MPDIVHQFSLPHTSVESVWWPDPTVNTWETLADFTFLLENKQIVKFSVVFLSLSVSWAKDKWYLRFPFCKITTALYSGSWITAQFPDRFWSLGIYSAHSGEHKSLEEHHRIEFSPATKILMIKKSFLSFQKLHMRCDKIHHLNCW